MRTELPLDQWNRKEHFQFFSGFDEPFFGIVAELDITHAYQKAKAANASFFLYYLYQTLKIVNAIEEFRYRIAEGKVYCYDTIHASPTISRDDTTFGFGFIEFKDTFESFLPGALTEIEAVRQTSGLCLSDQTGRIDVIHFSAIPWTRFTGLTHARHFAYKDSVPKVSVGKYYTQHGKMLLPVAVNVHHGLMDGYHVGKFLSELQSLFDQ
ncbi:chloramphenicol acetyltransferase [Xanthocytophaga agilis]|uniref:Chloramphenicol acetyltransferase n=1 Tax=Xanthocytophaga agilis TaxID=3048010 RepID=A0AAE3UJC0_9BACT|nr:chloramphenicol acetyltransferase [Xanthocytophaga agilis]MDJ1506611.1 chloramphenicol acetyltransferase [Xanthocytophaga agilis]